MESIGLQNTNWRKAISEDTIRCFQVFVSSFVPATVKSFKEVKCSPYNLKGSNTTYIGVIPKRNQLSCEYFVSRLELIKQGPKRVYVPRASGLKG